MGELSKSQIDKLGDRLRSGPQTEEDLRLLDEFRSSYSQSFGIVRQILHLRGVEPVARNIKSTLSIVAKLRRQPIKLSRIQDIAGCRIVVDEVWDQQRELWNLKFAFPDADIKDRRTQPSHGYRAVHLIVQANGKPFEIQVRTLLQHRWAELSEKASDIVDPEIKYGGLGRGFRVPLIALSQQIASYEVEQLAMYGPCESAEYGTITKALSDEREDRLARLFATIGMRVRDLTAILESIRP